MQAPGHITFTRYTVTIDVPDLGDERLDELGEDLDDVDIKDILGGYVRDFVLPQAFLNAGVAVRVEESL